MNKNILHRLLKLETLKIKMKIKHEAHMIILRDTREQLEELDEILQSALDECKTSKEKLRELKESGVNRE